MDVELVKFSEKAKLSLQNDKFLQNDKKLNFVHEASGYWMIIVLYHVLYQCYPELYDYIMKDENWKSEEKCKKTVQLYFEFWNKTYGIIPSNLFAQKWIEGLKVDAVIFIISMYKLKHIDRLPQKEKIDIVKHFFEKVITQGDKVETWRGNVETRLQRVYGYNENELLKIYSDVLESCINEDTVVAKP